MTVRPSKLMLLSALVTLTLAACATGDQPAIASDLSSAPSSVAMGRTCRALKRLMAIGREDIEAARESVIRVSNAGTTYASRLQVPGWTDCTIFSFEDQSADDPYIDHSLHCLSRGFSGNRAARRYVSDLYACTGDMFSERTLIQARSRGRYSLIGFDGELSSQGRGVSVDFGEIDFVRLSAETDVDWADVSVSIDYNFLKDLLPKEPAGDDPDEIILIH